MKKYPLSIAGPLLFLLFLLTSGDRALAADCLAIREKIEGETDILQRKELAKQGISDCPNDPIINFEYAYSMERLRKYKQALKHYQVAAKLASKYSKSYFGMGDMYMQLEMPGDAIKAYQMGLSLEPDNKRAQNSLEEAKVAAKDQGGGDTKVSSFINPLDSNKPAPKTPQTQAKTSSIIEEKPLPYQPTQAFIMQDPEIMKPLIANPLLTETIQSIEFDKANHSDITGTLDDRQMGAD